MSARFCLALFALCLSFSLAVSKKERFYKTEYIETPLDHFSFATNKTFKLRYLMNDTYWDRQNGPILFYTGNEGTIELFAEHTGLIWNFAPELNALIIFAEHRYYGKSLPFDKDSYNLNNVGYLTSSQALADYVNLISHLLKNSSENSNNPVIAIGGSYGGMLSAYIRMKYPHIVTGAIAASAPILQFKGLVECDIFNRIVTANFKSANASCSDNIRKSWSIIRKKLNTQTGKDWFFKEYNICKASQDDKNVVDTVISWLVNIYTNLAMVNYPYANDFLAPLPAYPVMTMCQYIRNTSLSDDQLLQSLFSAISVYTNFTGSTKCNNLGSTYPSGLDDEGWDYQACSEMVMPMCSTGVLDMFENSTWSDENFNTYCKKKWNVTPAYTLPIQEYGGDKLKFATNIVFSNGLLDPWASGGVMRTLNKQTIAIIIPEGAHHLDLMEPNINDPFSVKIARKFHMDMIKKWIQQSKVK